MAESSFDSWLDQFYGETLAAIDGACARDDGPARYALFRALDDGLWGLLLSQEYALYPNIRGLLPAVPEPALQDIWNGLSGLPLARQSTAFYAKVREGYHRHGERPLSAATVLDFGCGWGRLTRYFARDVAPGRLFGCDPVEAILDVCAGNRVPATLARSEFRPDALPFDEQFDLAYAFSVFTHLSEPAHLQCLQALHGSLRPGGTLILTIRPPAYLHFCEALRSVVSRPDGAHLVPSYTFVPHPPGPDHPQYGGQGDMDYGETVIAMAYIREHWTPLFELIDIRLLLDDPYQVMLTLRRR